MKPRQAIGTGKKTEAAKGNGGRRWLLKYGRPRDQTLRADRCIRTYEPHPTAACLLCPRVGLFLTPSQNRARPQLPNYGRSVERIALLASHVMLNVLPFGQPVQITLGKGAGPRCIPHRKG